MKKNMKIMTIKNIFSTTLMYINYFFRLIKECWCFKKEKQHDIKIENDNTFKVMSFNIRRDTPNDKENNWAFRRNSIISMILEYKPDIICFQEVMPTMAKFLISELSCMYNNTGVEIFTNREITKSNFIFGEGLLTMWRKDLFTLKNRNVVKLYDGRKMNLRRYLDAELVDKQGKTTHIINTHFCHMSETARNNSWEKLYAFVSKLDCNFYACGDFNCDKTYRNSKILMLMNDYSYNYKKKSSDTTISGYGTKVHTGEIIDYIFSNNKLTDFEIITKKYNDRYLSDHFPIINYY